MTKGDTPPGGLSLIEVASAAVVIWILFYCCSQLDLATTRRLFGHATLLLSISLGLASSFAAYMLVLMPMAVKPSARTASSLLAATVSTVLLFILVYADQHPALSFALLVLGPGNAIRSRAGLNRTQAIAAALFAAVVLVLTRLVLVR